MSVSASIEIFLTQNQNLVLNTPLCEIVKMFLGMGWTYEYEEITNILPIGHKNEFSWPGFKLSSSEFWDILYKKEELGELIGISLSWQKTEIGGQFLLDSKVSNELVVTILPVYDRQKKKEYDLTDFDWYLEKIIPAIDLEIFYIQKVVFIETK